jgi:arylsulfatase A-like enzyme
VEEGKATFLHLDEITIPLALRRAPGPGTATAAFGKWHLSNAKNGGEFHPNIAGFAHFAGTVGNIKPPEHGYHWTKYTNGLREMVGAADRNLEQAYHLTVTTNDALSWIRRQKGDWFVYVAYHAAHWPFQMPPRDLVDPDDHPPGAAGGGAGDGLVGSMIEALDHEIGRLWNNLPDETRKKTTLIVIGDNGSARTNQRSPYGARQKGTLYQGGIHVPLIISGSGVDPEQYGVSDALVHATDLFATAIELASGLPVESVVPACRIIDSVSLVPILRGRASAVHDYGFMARNARTGTIRNARYKLIRKRNEDELYDLVADPYERTNLLLGKMATQREVYDVLSRAYATKLARTDDACPSASAGLDDPAFPEFFGTCPDVGTRRDQVTPLSECSSLSRWTGERGLYGTSPAE